MTLTKQKPRRPTAHSRKRTGQHHRHSQHYIKAYWPYLPIFAILSLGIVLNSWLGSMHHSVLGYATDMSIQSLFDDTNAQRSANGESALNLNAQLDQAAQAKANDMAARDYWSHNTPDGQTPWSFITAAGYSYQTAGENLAYGFDTAADTLTGWMNSPEHRANILNTSFVDVGFGIVNIPNYQNSGPETLVVAMYASPATPAVAAATPAPSAPVRRSTEQPAAAALAPTNTSTSQDVPATATPATLTETGTKTTPAATPKASPTPSPEPAPQRLSRIQLVASGPVASWSMFATSLVTVGALFFFLSRHLFAWHKVLIKSERFVLHHPLLDIAAMAIVTIGLILSQTSGLIR